MIQSLITSSPTLAPPVVRIGRLDLKRFSVDNVNTLLRAGIVPEDGTFELLNGLIVRKDRSDAAGDPSMIGPAHRTCVMKLAALSKQMDSVRHHVASQQPMQVAIDSLPEPDFAVFRGTVDDYADRYPTGADALCVVEVADSSYERDTGEKLAGYARAGVPRYVVINLRNRTAEVYETPDVEAGTYARRTVVDAAGSLKLNGGEGGTIDVPLATLLP